LQFGKAAAISLSLPNLAFNNSYDSRDLIIALLRLIAYAKLGNAWCLPGTGDLQANAFHQRRYDRRGYWDRGGW
jgi:hypothetical protein